LARSAELAWAFVCDHLSGLKSWASGPQNAVHVLMYPMGEVMMVPLVMESLSVVEPFEVIMGVVKGMISSSVACEGVVDKSDIWSSGYLLHG
jgi:hypothetical protein